ncbi:type III secretion HpaP family protein [Paracidovorax citrulli]|uniref:type III secretion HpaP family protein n=1 Tax=Paracidovorax citrulli TaxID=80869 RepID=UPI00087EB2B2|nr:type III secretion HpaP family protein [Paracidovorax citrulli]QCX11133.1 type III secretion protein HpaP [Paracidovorax citrulli]UEG45895.1 hypothetical protein LKW27_19965 [Paracidovorax citrulli]UMT86809.1 hypothetical protein FRC90_01315 [Paracidovorax citrulli]UMT94850.1 hypothetical protein FRC97_07485 [Paracidovorax citrulli]WIY34351.1 type III secretion HpaP family protein [Paracidovorax citrulli]
MQRDLPPLRQGLASGRGTPAGALPPAPGAALRFQRHLLGDAAEDIPPATGFLAPGRRALASDPRDPRDPLPAAPPPSRATADPAPGTDGDAPPPATSAPPPPVATPDPPAAFGMPRAGEAGLPAVPAARPDDGACQAGPEAWPPPAGPATDAAAVPTCPPPPDPVPPPPPACGRQDGDASRQRGQDSGAGPSAASAPARPAAADAPAWLQDTVQRIAWLCAQADPAFQSWSVTVPMDPAVLPESEVALTLSPYAMSLRFRTRSCESARLISLHRDPLRAQLEALGPGQRGIDIDLESPP